eukprot:SAG31_NODE_2853_length_4992_cov_5.719599_7_plen_77_part_00
MIANHVALSPCLCPYYRTAGAAIIACCCPAMRIPRLILEYACARIRMRCARAARAGLFMQFLYIYAWFIYSRLKYL